MELKTSRDIMDNVSINEYTDTTRVITINNESFKLPGYVKVYNVNGSLKFTYQYKNKRYSKSSVSKDKHVTLYLDFIDKIAKVTQLYSRAFPRRWNDDFKLPRFIGLKVTERINYNKYDEPIPYIERIYVIFNPIANKITYLRNVNKIGMVELKEISDKMVKEINKYELTTENIRIT